MKMNFKNLVQLVVVLFFIATLTGCSTLGGGFRGAFTGAIDGLQTDFKSLQKMSGKISDEKDSTTNSTALAEQEALRKATIEQKLSVFHQLLLRPDVTPNVAVRNAKDVYAKTGDSRVWIDVDEFFRGRETEALVQYGIFSEETAFGCELVSSKHLTAAQKESVVKKSCDKEVYTKFKEENFPPEKVMTRLKKACPDLKK